MTEQRKQPGPPPETLRAQGVDWKDALKHALDKPKPKEGWPDDKPAEKSKPKN